METFKNPTTKKPKKSWQVLSAIFAFALYLIGVISSFITLSYDWSTGFIFIVLFFMGFLYVGISMLVAIIRDVYYQFKYILYIDMVIYIFAINLVPSEGTSGQGGYKFLWKVHSEDIPKRIDDVGNLGLNIVAMTTFIAMVLYLWWAVSPKRMKVNKQ